MIRRYGGRTPIAAIIPTRDNGQDLRTAVNSLRRTARLPQVLHVVVVDNGSREAETLRIIAEITGQSSARLVTMDELFNWSRLNNAAVASVDQALLLFCNDDIVMLSDGWDDILRGLLDRPEVGGSARVCSTQTRPSSMPALCLAGEARRSTTGFTRAVGRPVLPAGGR